MVRRIDGINAESRELNYHEDTNFVVQGRSFEAKPHILRAIDSTAIEHVNRPLCRYPVENRKARDKRLTRSDSVLPVRAERFHAI